MAANNRFIKAALVSLMSLLGTNPVIANSAEWLIPPQYDRMELFSSDLYKVSKNGKAGLISGEGKTILSAEYDLISDFHEGMAIFGNYTSDGIVLKGSINEDNAINHAGGTFYLLNDYPFYSEGFIPVMDNSGRYGYLDENCRPVFKFGNDETRPFSEGAAAVGEGENFHWLTMTGEEIFLSLPNGSYPYGGTNFYDGIAYLWDEYGEDFYIFDASGDIRKIKPRELIADYLYRVDSGLGSDIAYKKYEGRHNQLWKPVQRNGKWTYSDSKGQLLSSYQYDDVDYFQGGSARASINGKWGLLQIVEDKATFFTKADRKVRVFSSNKGSECSFSLSVPEKWQGENLTVTVRDPETGENLDLNKKANDEYSFSYQPDKSKTSASKAFTIDVMKDDMVIWEGEENYDFVQAINLLASLNVKNKADANNKCYVTATISNPSSISITTTVTLSGGGSNSQFNPQKVKLTIPANSRRSVTSAFILRGVELDGWCAVSTADGGKARKSNLQLKPRD